MAKYEVTAAGFDGSDKTNHLVFWIESFMAPQELRDYLVEQGIQSPEFDLKVLPQDCESDYEIPAETDRLLSLMAEEHASYTIAESLLAFKQQCALAVRDYSQMQAVAQDDVKNVIEADYVALDVLIANAGGDDIALAAASELYYWFKATVRHLDSTTRISGASQETSVESLLADIPATLPPGPWSAPSAAVYAADGRLVCSLGNAPVVKAYRARGDGNGAQLMDAARALASVPFLVASLADLIDRVRRDDVTDEHLAELEASLKSIGKPKDLLTAPFTVEMEPCHWHPGWQIPLSDLDYRISHRPLRFGKIEWLIKKGEDHVLLVNADRECGKTKFDSVTQGQQQILRELLNQGLIKIQ